MSKIKLTLTNEQVFHVVRRYKHFHRDDSIPCGLQDHLNLHPITLEFDVPESKPEPAPKPLPNTFTWEDMDDAFQAGANYGAAEPGTRPDFNAFMDGLGTSKSMP